VNFIISDIPETENIHAAILFSKNARLSMSVQWHEADANGLEFTAYSLDFITVDNMTDNVASTEEELNAFASVIGVTASDYTAINVNEYESFKIEFIDSDRRAAIEKYIDSRCKELLKEKEPNYNF
jgi:ubiquinone/menaquinone biosynthesis C-methylase UbiE